MTAIVIWILGKKYDGKEQTLIEFEELQSCVLKGDHLIQFKTDWDSCLLGMAFQPNEAMCELFFRKQLEQSIQLKPIMDQYSYEVTFHSRTRTYDSLHAMLDT